MQKYTIRSGILGSRLEIPCDHEDFIRISNARSALLEAIALEDTFDLLVTNYAEFERELLVRALDSMLHAPDNWSAGPEQLQSINRRLLNLLAACRMVLDHLCQRVEAIVPGAEVWPTIDLVRKAQYDAMLGYRLMDALRNHIQHRSLPIRRVRHAMDSVGTDPAEVYVRNTFVPQLNVDYLAEDRSIKRQIIEELRARGPNVNVRPLVREYVQGLGAVQSAARDAIRAKVDKAKSTLEEVWARWLENGGEADAHLVIVEQGSSTETHRQLYIGQEIVERHEKLRARNQWLNRFIRHYVSNDAPRLGNQA